MRNIVRKAKGLRRIFKVVWLEWGFAVFLISSITDADIEPRGIFDERFRTEFHNFWHLLLTKRWQYWREHRSSNRGDLIEFLDVARTGNRERSYMYVAFNRNTTNVHIFLLHLIYQQKAHLDRLLVEAVQALSMNREQQRNHYLKILFVHTRRHRSILKTTDRRASRWSVVLVAIGISGKKRVKPGRSILRFNCDRIVNTDSKKLSTIGSDVKLEPTVECISSKMLLRWCTCCTELAK